MTPADRVVIRKLVSFLPQFENGPEPTTENWFMDFYRIVTEKFRDIDYCHCIERLKDLEFIARSPT
jgi:hypothetical protein